MKPRHQTRCWERWISSCPGGPVLRLEWMVWVRSGVAHLWFVTIHPFEDGNGRVARAVTDMALAQDEGSATRLYSMSQQIQAQRAAYYDVLEQSQKGNGDITPWLVWFLKCFKKAIGRSEDQVRQALLQTNFWQRHAEAVLNRRQIKAVKRLLEAGPDGFEGGLTNRKYRNLTKTSRETAKRGYRRPDEQGDTVQEPWRRPERELQLALAARINPLSVLDLSQSPV